MKYGLVKKKTERSLQLGFPIENMEVSKYAVGFVQLLINVADLHQSPTQVGYTTN